MAAVAKTTEFTRRSAEAILRQACATAGLNADTAELVRVGDHAVFRLDSGRVVARVGRGPSRIESVRREVAVAGWLAAADYPAARLTTDAVQPVIVAEHPVTFWEGLADGSTYATTREMGELLHKLHSLTAPAFPLPRLDPFARVAFRLESAEIPDRTRSFLAQLTSDLSARYADLEFSLPSGPIHGDYNVGNVLHDANGQPKLIDLDGFCIGPREWDLMHTAMYYDSFGWHSEPDYRDFAEAYGFDVRRWPGYTVLRCIRELLMITWLTQSAGADPRAAAEVEKRVESVRSGGSRRDWSPF